MTLNDLEEKFIVTEILREFLFVNSFFNKCRMCYNFINTEAKNVRTQGHQE